MSKTHNTQKLKAEIRVMENEHKAERKELREAQRALSAWDSTPSKDKDWRDRQKLCDKVGSLWGSTTWKKGDLTRLYQARASLRGRLHMSKRVIHHSNGTKETENWTLETQAQAVEGLLNDYRIPSEEATKPAA